MKESVERRLYYACGSTTKLPDGRLIPVWLKEEAVRKKVIEVLESGGSYSTVQRALENLGYVVSVENLKVTAFKRPGALPTPKERFVAFLREITPSLPKPEKVVMWLSEGRTTLTTSSQP